jgi:hypothetical protein
MTQMKPNIEAVSKRTPTVISAAENAAIVDVLSAGERFGYESEQLMVTSGAFQNFSVFVLNDTNANARYLMVMTPNGTAVTPMLKPQ